MTKTIETKIAEKVSRKKKKALAKVGKEQPKRHCRLSAVQKLRRKEKRKAKAKADRDIQEINMMEYLVKSGWARGGIMNDVWTLAAWKEDHDDCKTTLCKAYRIQLKLDGNVHEKLPANMDDDLMEDL